MTETTEYFAVKRTRLYQIVVLLFILGIILGLIIGNLIWAPEPKSPEPDNKRPRHEKIKEESP